MKTGIMLLNLGTPDAPTIPAVRKYLAEFLMDPYVIDFPWLARALLVHGIILRTRPKRSAAAYQKVWTARGSPLAFHTLDLAEKLQREIGESCPVFPVMRYGNPSVQGALEKFQAKGVEKIAVFPLYPQYAAATTDSSIEWVKRWAKKVGFKGELEFVAPFYENPRFVAAFAARVREGMKGFPADRILFSFHGLPERAVKKSDRSGGEHCLRSANCCDRVCEANTNCYRAQCYSTAHRIAEAAGLQKGNYDIAFQSRLGPTRWIRPYSDHVLKELASSGKSKMLLVVAPSFVADCLETLEEISIRSREDFIRAGGEDLRLVESLNSSDAWVECLKKMFEEMEPNPSCRSG